MTTVVSNTVNELQTVYTYYISRADATEDLCGLKNAGLTPQRIRSQPFGLL
jgi:hypothetical protein